MSESTPNGKPQEGRKSLEISPESEKKIQPLESLFHSVEGLLTDEVREVLAKGLPEAKRGALSAKQLEFGDREARVSWLDGLTPLTMADDGREIRPSDRFLVHAIGWRDDPMHRMRRQSIYSMPGVFDPTQRVDVEANPMGVDSLKAMSCSLISGEKDKTWDSVGIIWQVTNPYGILQTSSQDIGMVPTPEGHEHEPQFKSIIGVEELHKATTKGNYNEVVVRGSCLRPGGLFVRVFPDGVPVFMGLDQPPLLSGIKLPGGEEMNFGGIKVPSGLERAQAIRQKILDATGQELPIIFIPEPFTDVSDKPFEIEDFDIGTNKVISHGTINLNEKKYKFYLENGKLTSFEFQNHRGFVTHSNRIPLEEIRGVVDAIKKQYEGKVRPDGVQNLFSQLEIVIDNATHRNGYWDYGRDA